MLNDNIRTVRKNRGFTQEDLASRLHVTRQTISKWEKGLSVPDAEMLSRLADELEVSVSELLGAKIETEAEENAIVEQLSRLNEQMAIRNRRSRRMFKVLGVVLAVIIIVPVMITCGGLAFFQTMRSSSDVDMAGKVTYECAIGDNSYELSLYYDEKYNILAADYSSGGIEEGQKEDIETESFIDNIVNEADNAKDTDERLRKYFSERGGTVKIISHEGLEL